MARVHWGPDRDLGLLQGDVNRLFERFFADSPAQAAPAAQRWVPAMDIADDGSHFVVSADLPGMDERDVTIEVHDNVLRISGERKSEGEQAQGWLRRERTQGSFRRSMSIPEGIDVNAIEATFERGVLELRIPKPVEKAPHRVEISTSGAIREAQVTEAAGDSSDPRSEQLSGAGEPVTA